MSDIAAALREAAARLASTSDTARLDAELLMAHALGISRSDMLLGHSQAPAPPDFAALIERRARHEPLAHIIGRQEFYGLDLLVTPDTLIPRGDSETLVEAAFEAFAGRKPPRRVIDLGTGTGALLFAVLGRWTTALGIALDASEAALRVARTNAERLGMSGRVGLELRDWTHADWRKDLGRFDLVLCNPPYIEADAQLDRSVRDYEPGSALFAGPDGLDDYRLLLPQLGELLEPGGIAVFEIGHAQADAVRALASEGGFAAMLRRDLAGRPRALILRENHS